MTKRSFEAIRRADHALVGVLGLVIATVSAAAGVASVYSQRTEQLSKAAPVAPVRVANASTLQVAPVSDALSSTLQIAPTADEVAVSASVSVTDHRSAPSAVIDASAVKTASIDVTQDTSKTDLLREHQCLSEVMYYEARGEGTDGQLAIAEVIFHRLHKGTYGSSICRIVYEGADRQHCQFSFACDGETLRPKTPGAWRKAQYLAAKILIGQERLANVTDGATNFHAVSSSPDWSAEMERTIQIGNHVFYKRAPRSRTL